MSAYCYIGAVIRLEHHNGFSVSDFACVWIDSVNKITSRENSTPVISRH